MFAVDVGGTFTDVVAVRKGEILTTKVSTDYTSVDGAVIDGAVALGLEGARVFNHASTHGLNAVITRNLPKVGVLVTAGHRDVLDHGRVARPGSATLDPHWRRPFGDAARPLVERYLRRPITERIKADGQVLFDLDEDQARTEIGVLHRCGVEGVAITLINSYVNAAHEERLRQLVHEVMGADIPVSISSEVSPIAQEYTRASTTVIDTSMKIIFSDYIGSLHSGLERQGYRGALNFADCAATLVPAAKVLDQPFRIVFAGPAAGTVASAHFGRLVGVENLICADVGGTSCDISLVRDHEPIVKTTFTLEHDLIVNALANDVTAIGAGGGSLVTVGPSGELQVGPGSAGSSPGPACYRKGGSQPTTTDTCLLAGIIDPDSFADGQIPLYREDAESAFAALECDFTLDQRIRYAFEIGVNNLAEGIFNVAIKNGVDPREFSLVAYGAAGPMLLPSAMEFIRCKRVIVPPHPGLFSALGLLSAEQKFSASRSAYTMLTPGAAAQMDCVYTEMERELLASVDPGAEVVVTRTFDGRLLGQTWDTPFVAVPDGPIDEAAIEAMVRNFHEAYRTRAGITFAELPVEGITFRVQVTVDSEKVDYPELSGRGADPLAAAGKVTIMYILDKETEVPVYDRSALCRGDKIDGPAIVRERLSTTFVAPRQELVVGRYGELVITGK